MTVDQSKMNHWMKEQEARKRTVEKPIAKSALKRTGGGGTSDDMVPMKEYVDARDDAIESRLDKKLDKLATKETIWGAVATALIITMAVFAFASSRFDSGMSMSRDMAQFENHQATVDASQDARIASMNNKLDVIIRQTAKH